MQFIKRIIPIFLSFTLITCCLAFHADDFSTTVTTTNTPWVITSFEQASNQNSYHINHRKAHSILENNFSKFNFKCCLEQHKSLFATQYNKQINLHIPNQTENLKVLLQLSHSRDDTFIG